MLGVSQSGWGRCRNRIEERERIVMLLSMGMVASCDFILIDILGYK